MKPGRLDGWGQIAAHLTAHAGVNVSSEQVRRYARRELDPLPARRIGRLCRQRVVCDIAELDAWAEREYATESTQTTQTTVPSPGQNV